MVSASSNRGSVRVCKGCEAASRGAGAKTRRGERGRRGEVSSTIAERKIKSKGDPILFFRCLVLSTRSSSLRRSRYTVREKGR